MENLCSRFNIAILSRATVALFLLTSLTGCQELKKVGQKLQGLYDQIMPKLLGSEKDEQAIHEFGLDPKYYSFTGVEVQKFVPNAYGVGPYKIDYEANAGNIEVLNFVEKTGILIFRTKAVNSGSILDRRTDILWTDAAGNFAHAYVFLGSSTPLSVSPGGLALQPTIESTSEAQISGGVGPYTISAVDDASNYLTILEPLSLDGKIHLQGKPNDLAPGTSKNVQVQVQDNSKPPRKLSTPLSVTVYGRSKLTVTLTPNSQPFVKHNGPSFSATGTSSTIELAVSNGKPPYSFEFIPYEGVDPNTFLKYQAIGDGSIFRVIAKTTNEASNLPLPGSATRYGKFKITDVDGQFYLNSVGALPRDSSPLSITEHSSAGSSTASSLSLPLGQIRYFSLNVDRVNPTTSVTCTSSDTSRVSLKEITTLPTTHGYENRSDGDSNIFSVELSKPWVAGAALTITCTDANRAAPNTKSLTINGSNVVPTTIGPLTGNSASDVAITFNPSYDNGVMAVVLTSTNHFIKSIPVGLSEKTSFVRTDFIPEVSATTGKPMTDNYAYQKTVQPKAFVPIFDAPPYYNDDDPESFPGGGEKQIAIPIPTTYLPLYAQGALTFNLEIKFQDKATDASPWRDYTVLLPACITNLNGDSLGMRLGSFTNPGSSTVVYPGLFKSLPLYGAKKMFTPMDPCMKQGSSTEGTCSNLNKKVISDWAMINFTRAQGAQATGKNDVRFFREPMEGYTEADASQYGFGYSFDPNYMPNGDIFETIQSLSANFFTGANYWDNLSSQNVDREKVTVQIKNLTVSTVKGCSNIITSAALPFSRVVGPSSSVESETTGNKVCPANSNSTTCAPPTPNGGGGGSGGA